MSEQIAVLRRGFGGLVFDAVLEESHTIEMEVTENPVETGVMVADHAFIKPYKVKITAGVTNTPLKDTAPDYGSGDIRAKNAFKALMDLQKTREPFDVQTGLRLYENMVCTSINTVQDAASANSLIFTAELREINIVFTQAVQYPPRKKGKAANQADKKKDSGEKQGKDVEPKKKSSLIKSGIGIFKGGKE